MRFDAIIVGSGQAANPLAEKMASKGLKVALVERSELGGTCVNRGCTPTKTMVHRAQVAHYARAADRWGVIASGVGVDLPKIVGQKNRVVRIWRESVEEEVAAQQNIRLFRGEAKFTGPHTIRVGDAELESDRIFLNTGARPQIPKIEGIESVPYLTSDSILDLEEVPEHLLVIGGGYIGLEFGQMFSRFGSRVTILQAGEQIVPREDPEIAAELQKALEAEGIKFILRADIRRVRHEKDFHLDLTSNEPVSGSHLLVATGRTPNTEALDLPKAGVEVTKEGAIVVNDKLETNVPGIWALGDVKGGPAFTHISYNDFQVVFANLFEGKDRSISGRIVPYCVFTDPQLGGVGMTEKEARSKGHRLKISSVPMSHVARAFERDETFGIMKLIVDASTDKILGATILGVEGGEIVQIISTLIHTSQPYTVMEDMIYIHPTLAEGLFRLFAGLKDAKPS